MFVKLWLAAFLAATMALTANPAQAEDCCKKCCKDKDCCKAKDICAKTDCCKREDCCKSKACSATKDCCKSKDCCKGTCCGCCEATAKHAKSALDGRIVVVVVPMSLATMPVCNVMPSPPAMPQSYGTPVPPPPPQAYYGQQPFGYGSCGTPLNAPMPCPITVAETRTIVGPDTWLSLLGMATDLCRSHAQAPSLPTMGIMTMDMISGICDLFAQPGKNDMTADSSVYLQHPPLYNPPSPSWSAPSPLPAYPPMPESPYASSPQTLPVPIPSCAIVPATLTSTAAKVGIVATEDNRLEMKTANDGCASCKKMTVKVGGHAVTMFATNGKVRVRATDLKASADSVRTDRKDHLILEGNVVLHYSKAGQHCSKVSAEHIELNLATGSMMVHSAGKSSNVPSQPVVGGIGVNY